ncbi:uncharacterized protein KQ657_003892 [Scheffersomyces spartinae]|uniref:Uncharacterized protein n=1 Tax=Scheffersomyces spartinae TaxID=45513 RepID=A0A9P7VCC4_9ASCO|nr:uncharacterized protein KQ657_003892 [Scheffersomyces spartinae]KAG7195364.1 hypothetical protein KQ657_003892 [Scheffersomyces spartinae]
MRINSIKAQTNKSISLFTRRCFSYSEVQRIRKDSSTLQQDDQNDSKVDLTAALRSGRRLTSNIKNISRELVDDTITTVKKEYHSEIQKTLSTDVQQAIKSLDSRSKKLERPKRKTKTKPVNLLSKPRSQDNEKLLSWGVSTTASQLSTTPSDNNDSNNSQSTTQNKSRPPKRLPKFPRRLKYSTEYLEDGAASDTPKTRRHRQHLPPLNNPNSTHILTRVLSNTVSGSKLELLHSPKGVEVPRLAHGLDRALFSPGVHFLQDPRTRIYNFSPNLKQIHDVSEYDKSLIPSFISASKDTHLFEIAQKNKKSFISSTSSMTKVLTLFYLFLNDILRKAIPKKFGLEPPEMSKLVYNLSATVLVEPKGNINGDNDGKPTYSVSSDKSMDTELYLSALGHCLELMLTTEYGKVNVLVKNSQSTKESSTSPLPAENVYSYSTCGEFLLRSQIDCYDDRLPGNGTFDLKTRAVGAIRHDSKSYSHTSFGRHYQIWRETGEFESFEREKKDLIRTGALLKYGFQARIGGMDGIYVAYHNTHEFFGFQYIPLTEIDRVFYDRQMNYDVKKLKTSSLYSLENLLENLAPYVAKEQFERSIDMWTDLLNQTIQKLPEGCAFRMTFKLKKSSRSGPNKLRIFAVPVLKDDITQLDLFSELFETSFRFKHTPDVIFKELMKHRNELDAFNKKLISEKEIAVFDLDLFHPQNSEYDVNEEFKLYPKHIKDSWKTKYRITQLHDKDANTDEYCKIMANESKFLVEGFILSMAVPANLKTTLNEMLQKGEVGDLNAIDFEADINGSGSISTGYRKYSDIGEKRKKEWRHRDFVDPKIYKQS